MRPAGWWDGDPWRDPAPVARHLTPYEAARHVRLSVSGRRTRPAPCGKCGGVVVEDEEGTTRCTKPPRDGGCGFWRDSRKDPSG